MSSYTYGYAMPSSSSGNSSPISPSEQEQIKEAFESIERETMSHTQPVQSQTGWLGAPIAEQSLSKIIPVTAQTAQPGLTVQSQPIQPTTTTWMGARVSEETKPSVTHPMLSQILSSQTPLEYPSEGETVTVLGQTGVLANREELLNWSGPIPLSEYPINEDPNPEVIRKVPTQQVTYDREICVRYLKPKTPPPPGDIIIKQDKSFVPPPAPPLVIRQQPPRPKTPPPLVFREAPPKSLQRVETKVITIPGKKVPPPPRKVVIERLPQLPPKPQSVLVERWLPYREQKRKVIFQKPTEPEAYYEKPKNVIIQWESPNVNVNTIYRDLGVVQAIPEDFVMTYRETLKQAHELPDYIRNLRPPEGILLASDVTPISRYELEGDVHALSLVDLDKEGLSEYKYLVGQTSSYIQSIQQPVAQQQFYQQPNQYQIITPAVQPQPQKLYSSSDSYLSYLIDKTLERQNLKNKQKVEFEEAKNVIKDLNEKLNRRYEDAQTEKFLESIHLVRDTSLDLVSFKNALLRNLQFYSTFMF